MHFKQCVQNNYVYRYYVHVLGETTEDQAKIQLHLFYTVSFVSSFIRYLLTLKPVWVEQIQSIQAFRHTYPSNGMKSLNLHARQKLSWETTPLASLCGLSRQVALGDRFNYYTCTLKCRTFCQKSVCFLLFFETWSLIAVVSQDRFHHNSHVQ